MADRGHRKKMAGARARMEYQLCPLFISSASCLGKKNIRQKLMVPRARKVRKATRKVFCTWL